MPVSYKEISFEEVVAGLKNIKDTFLKSKYVLQNEYLSKIYYFKKCNGNLINIIDSTDSLVGWIDETYFIKVEE